MAFLGLTACGSDNAGTSSDDMGFNVEENMSGSSDSNDVNADEGICDIMCQTQRDSDALTNMVSNPPPSSSSLVAVDPSSIVKSSFSDTRDGQLYRIVTIGSQVWMAENLNYKMTGSKTVTTVDGYAKYGQFYNWNAAMSACPAGWHLPSYDEYKTLFNNVGPTGVVNNVGGIETVEGKVLKSTSDEWYGAASGGSCAGTDAYGFAALPADYNEEGLNYQAQKAVFWSYSTIYSSTKAYAVSLYWNECRADISTWSEDKYFSVRCLKD